jgi:predicted NAD/FAD-dependent oxidoreductase
MSPLMRMAAERAEHEQVQVRARARMPLLPPVLRGFGGRLAHRVLHGVDVLFGHRALRVLASAVAAAFRRCGR